MPQITCVVVTPEETALESTADFVALPLYDGEIGIGVNHSPMIGRLSYGEMRLRTGNSTVRYYVDGGFVQVADNVVSVLTSRAIPGERVDSTAAQKLLETAMKRPGNTPELVEIRERLVGQARGQLSVARRQRG